MISGQNLEFIVCSISIVDVHLMLCGYCDLLQVNGCNGKMGRDVIQAAISAGLHPVPVSFSRAEESGQTVEVCGKEIKLHGPSGRESILASIVDEYPNLIVVDYTVPNAVNGKYSWIFFSISGEKK